MTSRGKTNMSDKQFKKWRDELTILRREEKSISEMLQIYQRTLLELQTEELTLRNIKDREEMPVVIGYKFRQKPDMMFEAASSSDVMWLGQSKTTRRREDVNPVCTALFSSGRSYDPEEFYQSMMMEDMTSADQGQTMTMDELQINSSHLDLSLEPFMNVVTNEEQDEQENKDVIVLETEPQQHQ